MSRLKILLLGSIQVTLDSEPLTNFQSDKARALLAYLAVESDRPHRREFLAGLLWPETPERTARTNLRSALANLRQLLQDNDENPPFLLVTRQTIQFNIASDYWMDLEAFRDEATGLISRQEFPEERISSAPELNLEAAVELYRGQFLAGFFVRDALAFEEWVLIMRESLQRVALIAMNRLTKHYLEGGVPEQALEIARRQVELEPYQESAHQQVILGLALSGQRNEALVHYEKFKDLLQVELGVLPLDQTQNMYEQLVDGQLPELPKSDLILRREPRTVGPCPYRGLTAFTEEDAPYFFGREDFIDLLIERIIGHPHITVIVGSSGLGKSSAVFAGLFPRLQDKSDWLCLSLRPGRQPIQTLVNVLLTRLKPNVGASEIERETQNFAEDLLKGESSIQEILQIQKGNQLSTRRILIVIDQFEELYTLCPETTVRRRFLDILLDVSNEGESQKPNHVHVILNLRADFMGQALGYRPFVEILNSSTQILGPMSQADLRKTIEKPANVQGAAFEAGLVTRILDDIGQEPGNLPLLEFALTILWDHLDEGWFTHEAYEEIGRVDGALARYAEEVFLALDENQKGDAQGVFVQLVQPGQGTEDTRRLAAREEFDEKRWNLIQKLAGKRLVVTGQDAGGRETVEIVHEALIREWDRLRGWVENDRAFRVWQEQMRTALIQWEDSQQDQGALLRGVTLSKAENWLIERGADLSVRERHFIEAGLHERDERQKAEASRQERERLLERRSRIFLQVLLIVLLLAMFVSIGFALVARNETRQAIVASSLSLAANASQAMNEKDSTSALVLAMAANRIQDPPLESQRVLIEAAFSPGPRKQYNPAELFMDVNGPPLSVVIMPDSRSSLTGFFDGNIILWDIETGKELLRFSGHAPGRFEPRRIVEYSGVNDIALSPDGLLAISGGDDGNVILWHVDSGEEIRRFEGHTGAVRAVDISPDGLLGISGGLSGDSLTDNGELILWDLRTGEEIRRFEGQTEAVVDLSISPDDRKVIASSGEVIYGGAFQTYSLLMWDLESGEIIHRFEGIERDLPGLSINSESSLAITASTDHELILWDLITGEHIRSLDGHNDLVRVVEISPDDRRAISGGGDGEVILWNLQKGEVITRFDAHTAGINDIAFSIDGQTSLSVSNDGKIILWDLHNAAQINRFEGHEAAVLDIAFIPEEDYFVSASGLFDPAAPIIEEDSIRIWNLENRIHVGSLDWHISDIFQLDVSPDERRVLTGNMVDQNVQLWDLDTGLEIRRFEGHAAPLLSVAFVPESQENDRPSRGISGAINGTIFLWDLESAETIQQYVGHEGGIWALAVSPDGRTILSGADDRLLIFWDLETGQEIRRFAGHAESISGVAYSLDGKKALSGDTLGMIVEWDLESGEEIQRFEAHAGTGPVGRTRVAYLPETFSATGGPTALSSGWDGTLALWDLRTGELLHRYRGHDSDFIFDIAISPDGQSALSCGTDKTIIQWQLNIPTMEELHDWISENRYVREMTCDEKELFQIEPLCIPGG